MKRWGRVVGTVGLLLAGCGPREEPRGEEVSGGAGVGREADEAILRSLKVPVRVDFRDEAAGDAWAYLELKLRETGDESGNGLGLRQVLRVESEKAVNLAGPSIPLGEAIAEVNRQSGTISVFGKFGWVVLPEDFRVDSSVYQDGVYPGVYVEVTEKE